MGGATCLSLPLKNKLREVSSVPVCLGSLLGTGPRTPQLLRTWSWGQPGTPPQNRVRAPAYRRERNAEHGSGFPGSPVAGRWRLTGCLLAAPRHLDPQREECSFSQRETAFQRAVSILGTHPLSTAVTAGVTASPSPTGPWKGEGGPAKFPVRPSRDWWPWQVAGGRAESSVDIQSWGQVTVLGPGPGEPRGASPGPGCPPPSQRSIP